MKLLPRLQSRFTSPLHAERPAALLGAALGISFTVCFVTGLYSHWAQHPPSWFTLPARPAGLYRVTQGLHVATGIATIPLLLAKLWTVFPKLLRWPPFDDVAHALERVSLVPLIGGSLLLLFTGLANINDWYPWPFNFVVTHYWTAWITVGALIVHVGAKWTTTWHALTPRPRTAAGPSTEMSAAERAGIVERRNFLATVAGAVGLLTLVTIGETVAPLQKLALLAPRRPDVGPQGFPVNRSAVAAGVTTTARDPGFTLRVEGNVRRTLTLTLDDLVRLPQTSATLPIACVDGWSTSQRWTGIRVRDLLDLAGAPHGAHVTVESLQQRRSYRTSELDHVQARDPDTLLATRVNGEVLHVDHGYPLRLIGPDRPGVMQTKWVARLVVR
ncbi:MAG TPA: molybdopterin-dependent oxidoreductase [Acidimicrobiia bacterium]|jgi:DMSO/TMAO reductase YedYZ molybdopterin-dependent catalytic subunit